MKLKYLYGGLLFAFFMSCGPGKNTPPAQSGPKEFPVLGNGPVTPFGFVAHTGDTITEKNMDGKLTVMDFFFTSCPTICPKMKTQLLRVYEKYRTNDRVLILSHSIDPEFDTKEVLADFAKRLEVSGDRWYFLTGDKDSIYARADQYMISAKADASAPGGYAHSGAFLLIDGDRNIRGMYDGTREQAVDSMMADMDILLKQ